KCSAGCAGPRPRATGKVDSVRQSAHIIWATAAREFILRWGWKIALRRFGMSSAGSEAARSRRKSSSFRTITTPGCMEPLTQVVEQPQCLNLRGLSAKCGDGDFDRTAQSFSAVGMPKNTRSPDQPNGVRNTKA